MLTLGQAAKRANVAKSTISRALDSGALSKREKVGNSYRIDPAELQRWIDNRAAQPSENVALERSATDGATTSNAPQDGLDVLKVRAELEVMQARFAMLERSAADLREDRDKWRNLAERQQGLAEGQQRQIEDLRTAAEIKAAERPSGLRGWFGRRKASNAL